VVGGPLGDCGVTGRKIIVDTYGGRQATAAARSPVKTRARWIGQPPTWPVILPRTSLRAGLADRVEVQVAYSIGVAEPVSLMVNTMGTEKIPEDRLNQIVRESFTFKPAEMINYLKLLRPIFKKTSCYGHFGRNDPDFTWEKTDMVDTLREKAGL